MGEEPLTPDSLVLILLQSTEGWDPVSAFVALTTCHKMESLWEQQNHRPVPNSEARHPPQFAASNPAVEEEGPGWSTSTSTSDGRQ